MSSLEIKVNINVFVVEKKIIILIIEIEDFKFSGNNEEGVPRSIGLKIFETYHHSLYMDGM